MIQPKTFYRPELDTLRFIAFTLVYLFHVCTSLQPDMAAQGGATALVGRVAMAGAWGVDLFFLLSAYLITTLLLRECEATGHIAVAAFYRRRMLRIWPLYFSFVAFCFALKYVTPARFPVEALLAFLFMAGNWSYGLAPFVSPVIVLWSLSIEEQFYLLWPLALRRSPVRVILAMAAAMLVVATAARALLLLAGASHNLIWCATFTRLDPIALGIILAVGFRRLPQLSALARTALGAAGVGCMLVGSMVFHATGDGPLSLTNGLLGFPFGAAGALLLFISILGAPLRVRWTEYLGRISYGLYVFHLFALEVAKTLLLHRFGTCPWWARGLLAAPATLAMAAISYRWLEAPFLRLKGAMNPAAQAFVPNPG